MNSKQFPLKHAAAIALISLFLNGFTLYRCWQWFLVPLGIPMLQSYAHALGIVTLFDLVTTKFKKLEGSLEEWYSYVILTPSVTLLIAYVVYCAM